MRKRYSNIEKLIKQIKGKNTKDQPQKFSNVDWQPFSTNINENEKTLKQQLGTSKDILFTKFTINLQNGDALNAMVVAIDGLIDEEAKRNNILKPLIAHPLQEKPNDDLKQIRERISVKKVTVVDNLLKAVYQVLKAKALLIVDGFNKGLLLSIEGYEVRSIEEPVTEQAVRGAREGFIESTGVNISLLRRRISHPSLRFETMEIGKYSQTGITMAYLKDIVDPDLVQRVKERLNEIKVDSIDSSGDIEQLIEDHPYSIFPTIGNTERTDKAAALLMEGRVLLLIDGNPVSLYVPNLFLESFQNVEDYNSRPYYSSFIRIMRFFAFIVSISLPALYITALNFNKALIPSDMIVPIIQARETVPFPLAMEVIMMILMFEVVREAGVRLPKQIGSALSIVGALILGDVSVSAGLVGAPTIVVVSISYIAAFVITPIADVTALVRIGLFIASSVFGSYGLCIASLALLTHMVSLTSLGVPYMAPFSPSHFKDWKDGLIRLPTKLLKQRPKSIPNGRSRRIKSLPDTGDKR
ncbi:spore germination protein [Pueribacillus theae]|uniref:Spore germination protein n=1 Tax=Pueribacillus theae TaxID=2171751 RepID=A0A2U1JN21_9BACI|nr:spore germination protein [Pueribacillus theae]PWA06283.1 spore germination protein [Pueribacillus theae]